MFALIPVTRCTPSLKRSSKSLGEIYPLSAKSLPYSPLASTFQTSGFLSSTLAPVRQKVIISPGHYSEVQLEPVTPPHRSLPVRSHALENLVGIAPEVMTDGNHRAVHEADTRAAAKGIELKEKRQLEEYAAFKFHEPVIGYRIRKVPTQMYPDIMQIVVLEVGERAKMNTIRMVIISPSEREALRCRRRIPFEETSSPLAISISNFLLKSSTIQKISVILSWVIIESYFFVSYCLSDSNLQNISVITYFPFHY